MGFRVLEVSTTMGRTASVKLFNDENVLKTGIFNPLSL